MENTVETTMEMTNPVHKMVCARCGKEINGQFVKEYCQSPYIHKWLKETLPLRQYRELKELALSRDNVIFVHEECSYERTREKVNVGTLHLGRTRKERISEIYTKMKPYSDLYRNMRGRIVVRQERKCYKCGCEIKEKYSILRRIDTTKPRTEENGCLVCYSCDEKYRNFLEP